MFGWRPVASLDDIAARRRSDDTDESGHPVPPPSRQSVPRAAEQRTHGLHKLARSAPPAEDDGRTRLGYLVHQARSRLQSVPATVAAAPTPPEGPSGPEPPRGTAEPDLYDKPATEAPQMAKYLSKEWVDASRRTVEEDPRFQRHTEGVRASILCVVHEQPAHADEVFFIDFDDGQIVDLYSGAKSEFDKRGAIPTFEVHGDYETFREIQTGHLTQSTALMRGKLRLRGSLLKALKYMKALDVVTDILRETPTEF